MTLERPWLYPIRGWLSQFKLLAIARHDGLLFLRWLDRWCFNCFFVREDASLSEHRLAVKLAAGKKTGEAAPLVYEMAVDVASVS